MVPGLGRLLVFYILSIYMFAGIGAVAFEGIYLTYKEQVGERSIFSSMYNSFLLWCDFLCCDGSPCDTLAAFKYLRVLIGQI